MSQFDQTTEKKAEEFSPNRATSARANSEHFGFIQGRNSTKASMEILARAVELCKDAVTALATTQKDSGLGLLGKIMASDSIEKIEQAIAQVKANGDWPLEEK